MKLPCKLSASELKIWREIIEPARHLEQSHAPLAVSYVKLCARVMAEKNPPLSLHRQLSTTAALLGLSPPTTRERRVMPDRTRSGRQPIEWERPKANGHFYVRDDDEETH